MTLRKIVLGSTVIVLVLVVALYVLVLAGLWIMQDRLLFARRTNEMTTSPAARDWAYEDVWLEVLGEKTHGWWIPVEQAHGVILFAHGSGRNISGYLEDVALFREQGMSVLLYDYGGYGLSSGTPSEERLNADARAMWDYLVQTQAIVPERIVLAGSSLGGGVTTQLAVEVAPAAVILESTFTSVPGVVSGAYPFLPARWLCRIQFRNIDKVSRLQCPVLVVHSKDDTVIPFDHGRQLYARITAPKMFVEISGAHYGGKFTSRETYAAGLKAFFARYPVSQGTQGAHAP